MTLDDHTRAALLRRIGLTEAPAADLAGLRTVHRAFVASVPYEDLAVQLGESAPLEARALVDRILAGGRGGYCFEANTVLAALLRSLGFAVQLRQGVVGPRDAAVRGEPTNHLALVVDLPEGQFIAEAGLGEGPLDPLPLVPGAVMAGSFELLIERDPNGWWVSNHGFGSFAGFHFADQAATIEDFQPHHRRLSTSSDSSFVKTLVVQQPYDDRIVSLRSRTLTVAGPGRSERRVLEDSGALTVALREAFGIDPDVLGAAAIARLWSAAAAQHEAHGEHSS